MSNFYQEAILDAKAVRASAQAVAKAALQEEFEPKVNALVSKHLAEELEEELEAKHMAHHTSEEEMDEAHEEELDEATLDEILAELDAISEEGSEEEMQEAKAEEELDEAKNKEEELDEAKEEESAQHPGEYKAAKIDEAEEEGEEEETEEAEDDEEAGEEAGEAEEEAPTDDTKVIDITLGDLKQVLQALMPHHDGEVAVDGSLDGGAEVSLDEILDELSQMEEAKDKEKIGGHKDAALKAAEKETGYKELAEKKEDEEEMEEAKKTIEELRSTLQEVNLLNAKLLYMNKLFRTGNLNEAQKMNIVKNLDKAETAKEAEKIYNTLKESFTVRTKSTIKESRGFASQAAGIAPKNNIVEAEPFVNRWQVLAGIKNTK